MLRKFNFSGKLGIIPKTCSKVDLLPWAKWLLKSTGETWVATYLLYMELHDLLLFGKKIGGQYQIDWQDHVATIQGKRPTRSTNHENLQDDFYNPLTNLSVSKENSWYRVVQLYSIIGKKVSIYSSNIKAELTVYYQEYLAIYYDYDDKKTWRGWGIFGSSFCVSEKRD